MTAPKRLTELTASDFAAHRAWLVELPALETARPAEEIANLETDSPVVALTRFVLQDGTKLNGYFFVYDATGFAVFANAGGAVRICDSSECSEAEARAAADRLGKPVEAVFPVKYEATVRVFGRTPNGEIRLQTNTTPHSDARTSAAPDRPPSARAGGRER